ncbi:hypothetical protein GC174_10090 [bacterium]|nr:hypothetical protein [bacterium]
MLKLRHRYRLSLLLSLLFCAGLWLASVVAVMAAEAPADSQAELEPQSETKPGSKSESAEAEPQKVDSVEKPAEAKKAVSEEEMKAYFRAWFKQFYSKLYYAKDLTPVKDFYTRHCRVAMEHQDALIARGTLVKLKATYVGNPKIASVTMHPGGLSCDVRVDGNIKVYKSNGRGYCLYRMVKEGPVWRIDSAMARGKAETEYKNLW